MNTTRMHAWKKWLRYTVAVAALQSAIATVPSFADEGERDQKTATPIRHVVVIIPENRTFDNYFGTYPHAANIPGEQSWLGVPAPKFVARDELRRRHSKPTLLAGNIRRVRIGPEVIVERSVLGNDDDDVLDRRSRIVAMVAPVSVVGVTDGGAQHQRCR